MMILQVCLRAAACASVLTFFFFATHAQDDAMAIKEIKAFRAKQQKDFRDRKLSPMLHADRKKFRTLNYFPVDLRYRLAAKFVKTENSDLFRMRTTTDRLPEYRKYGEVHFSIEGRPYQLEVYQSPDIMKRSGYEDYLFIPFTDLTNGKETYEVGRYLEFRIPEGEDVILDFNKSYNPYCSYNPEYSCPIPPEPNHLPVEIPAGEKKFKEDH